MEARQGSSPGNPDWVYSLCWDVVLLLIFFLLVPKSQQLKAALFFIYKTKQTKNPKKTEYNDNNR
jgi:hypothetical protein